MPITIQLPPEAERRLTELAIRTGRDVDFYLREMVQRGLEDVIGGVPSLESLREKYCSKEDEFRDSGKDNLSVRIYRALSWTERGQKEMERGDPDATFIFYWIGFDSLCSGQLRYPASKKKIKKFLRKAVKADRDASIYNLVIANESKTILTLAANAYVFTPFWNRYYDGRKSAAAHKWANSLIGSVRRTIANLKLSEKGIEKGIMSTLEILFDCLIELRNQLVHGGATWNSRVNRHQVGDGARIISRLLPVFLDLVMDNPNSFNSDVGSPPPGLDSPEIKAEHNDYVRKLAETANGVDRDEYREYLREAIERELAVKEDYEFAACVRDILDG